MNVALRTECLLASDGVTDPFTSRKCSRDLIPATPLWRQVTVRLSSGGGQQTGGAGTEAADQSARPDGSQHDRYEHIHQDCVCIFEKDNERFSVHNGTAVAASEWFSREADVDALDAGVWNCHPLPPPLRQCFPR